jgi:hypothetical protein
MTHNFRCNSVVKHPPPSPHVLGSSPLCTEIFCSDGLFFISAGPARNCWAGGPGLRSGCGWPECFVFVYNGYVEPFHYRITN